MNSERRAKVEQARAEWIRRLIDLSRRNNLLYYRSLQLGTLDLSEADPAGLAALLAGESVALSKLLPAADLTKEAARAKEIRRRATANMEERGLETLFLALGMATWPSQDAGRPAQAAVVLLPMRIELKGREGRSLSLQRAGDPQANLALLHVLAAQFSVTLSEEELLGGDAEDQAFDLEAVLSRLVQAAARVEGFLVEPRAVLGNFSFQKMAMVKDLIQSGDQLVDHDLISAIAGDEGARESLGALRNDIDQRELDAIPPGDEFLVLDADSSQQSVIYSAHRGANLVVQGPPGTGKSQTIANLIASFAADGKRVLFVAEKRAALEAVFKRLNHIGLGHIALDLHGADISRRATMEKLGDALGLAHEALDPDSAELHETFTLQRKCLNEHVARLHSPREPSGVSVYEMQGSLLRLSPEARSAIRWRGKVLTEMDADRAKEIVQTLTMLTAFGPLFIGTATTPWTGAKLSTGQLASHVVELVQATSSDHLPRVRSDADRLARELNVRAPTALGEFSDLLELLSGIGETLQDYRQELFAHDLQGLTASLAPARRGVFATAWAFCSDARFRAARRTLRNTRTTGPVSAARLLADVEAAKGYLERWRSWALGPDLPRDSERRAEVARGMDQLKSALSELAGPLPRYGLADEPLETLTTLFAALVADEDTPYRIPRLLELERRLEELGAAAVLHELRSKERAVETWPQVFEHAWLSSCLDAARAEDSGLAAFDGSSHQRVVTEFWGLDEDRLAVSAARVRRAHAELLIDAMNTHPEQATLVRREVQKRARHMPLRRLFARAPDVLTAICPCWMASPLSVSQLLASDRQYFDVCIFDEASQVLPEDAVTALLRASQAVVAGDRHQLPPTTFFADAGFMEDEEEAQESVTGGFESVLDVMSVFVNQRTLDWHYRSRNEALIAFSNHQIYHGRLVTFPSVGAEPALQHVLVRSGVASDTEEDSVSAEVQRVVDLVLEHARTRPRDTLGVIAMGIKHADRIQAAVDSALQLFGGPDLDEFFDESREERFFIKNLERVQGDERDAIIISVGYGKDRSGRLLYRFGPLLYDGGERRLNVAITRARKRVTLVSSFSHLDMDPGRSSARGVELLRLYLQYAASGGSSMGDGSSTAVPLNAFEADVFDTLSTAGIPLISQWGASRYRIDMVAKHPRTSGRLVLAIECDGASYHSSYTARDRDRLRQQHLEALGWRFHRIWSQDWFYRRESEIARARQAYDEAVLLADKEDARGGAPMDSKGSTAIEPPTPPGTSNAASTSTIRGSCPIGRPRPSIDDYSMRDLVTLVKWIKSDGRLRTDDQILDEAIQELGFKRRGSKIIDLIRRAIDQAR